MKYHILYCRLALVVSILGVCCILGVCSMPRAVAPARQPAVVIGTAPKIGNVEVGIFSPEAGKRCGVKMDLWSLQNATKFQRYHAEIKALYGADLADFNYISAGAPGWQEMHKAFRSWLFAAAAYGAPTVALEPLGATHFGIFADNAEMQDLRAILQEANTRGITVWVRFASECNLRLSEYSIYNDSKKIAAYRHAVRWFHAYMPSNARLVFSPLINTVYLKQPEQLRTIREMYEAGAYERIGGTLYATSWLEPTKAYDWYYHFMLKLDAKTPFQICEFEGSHKKRDRVIAFLGHLRDGRWPKVQRINFFAGPLNALAEHEHGEFGFVRDDEQQSFIAKYFQ